jgi:hypothetical protein
MDEVAAREGERHVGGALNDRLLVPLHIAPLQAQGHGWMEPDALLLSQRRGGLFHTRRDCDLPLFGNYRALGVYSHV